MFMCCPTNDELFKENCFLLDDVSRMDMIFERIDLDPSLLVTMKEKSIHLAEERLEYMKLFADTIKYSGIRIDLQQ